MTLFDIGDMVNVVASFADDDCLFKMSMLNQKTRRFVVYDYSIRGKDRLIRVLRYQLRMANKNLDKVMSKM